MYPIALDLTKISVLLVGRGPLVKKRRRGLEEAGATQLTYIEIPSPFVGEGQGGRGLSTKVEFSENNPLPLTPSHKGREDLEQAIANATVILAAGLPRQESEQVVALAHKHGKLVNIEDVNDLCDFYFTANVKRGDLVIAVSTSGASPTLARKVRDWIATRFGNEWADYTNEIKNLRHQWKQEGKNVMATSEEYIQEREWLPDFVVPAQAEISASTGVDREIPAFAGITEKS